MRFRVRPVQALVAAVLLGGTLLLAYADPKPAKQEQSAAKQGPTQGQSAKMAGKPCYDCHREAKKK